MSENLKELLNDLQSGDETVRAVAWQTINQTYRDRLVGYAHGKFTHNRADAENIVQETFLWLAQCCNSLPCLTLSFLEGRVRYRFLALRSRRKAKSRDTAREVTLSQSETTTGDGVSHQMDLEDKKATSPEHRFDVSEIRAEIERALCKLPEELSNVVRLRVFEELTFDQIATVLHANLSTVNKRYHDAIGKLRKTLIHIKE